MASPSITATNAGNVSHPQVPLGGPVFVALRVLGYLVVAGAVAIVVDALRRPASHFGGNGARRWMWAGPQMLLLVLIGLSWLTRADALAGATALYLFFVAMLQVAYLLVVVFPRHHERAPQAGEESSQR
ncbi:MAG TPA: hypothetical protein VGK50_01845 [Coriobacteriia bacterium]